MRKADDLLETYLVQTASGAPVEAPEAGLEPMLRAAMQIRRVGTIAPSPASVERIRIALRRVPAREIGARATAPRLGLWRRPVMGLAFAVMVLALGTTSALAAPSALPDSPLYSVRNWRESVQVQLAGNSAQRATLYATFAAERTTQLRRLAEHRAVDPGVATTLLRDIEDRLHHANQEAHNDGPSARSTVRDIEGQIGDQLAQIQQQGEISGNAGAQLTQTLRSVQSGQSGSDSNSGGNGNTNQP
jgi:hypothetical protein